MADGIADELAERPKQLKQSRRNQVSARRAKTAGGKEILDEQRRLKELEASIRSQVAAEERAHKIVEELVLKDEISADFLLHAGNYITTSHYADVVEERMIAKKCGYPLCNNQLNQIPTQRYKISLRTNRVYDITERKCFCSNLCFKASKYFESQISDSPVWTRIGQSLRTFSLLESDSSSTRAGSGDLLLGGEDKKCLRDDLQGDCPSGTEHESWKEHKNDNEEKVRESRIHKCKVADSDRSSHEAHSVLTIPESCPGDEKDIPTAKEDTRKETYSRDTIVQSVQNVFQEWITQSTLEHLGLSVKTKAESGVPVEVEKDPYSFAARVAQFLRPPTMNAEEDSDSDSELETSPRVSEDNTDTKERKSVDKNSVCILPPIDSKSQNTIRRRVVLEKLFRTLPDLLSELKLTVGEISRDLTELVHTFSLTNTNVSLKPLQWKIVALVLIVILQRKNCLLSQAMESYCSELDALLHRLGIRRHDIDVVLSPLTSHIQPPNSGQRESREAVNTCKSPGGTDKIEIKQREHFGDMEELD